MAFFNIRKNCLNTDSTSSFIYCLRTFDTVSDCKRLETRTSLIFSSLSWRAVHFRTNGLSLPVKFAVVQAKRSWLMSSRSSEQKFQNTRPTFEAKVPVALAGRSPSGSQRFSACAPFKFLLLLRCNPGTGGWPDALFYLVDYSTSSGTRPKTVRRNMNDSKKILDGQGSSRDP